MLRIYQIAFTISFIVCSIQSSVAQQVRFKELAKPHYLSKNPDTDVQCNFQVGFDSIPKTETRVRLTTESLGGSKREDVINGSPDFTYVFGPGLPKDYHITISFKKNNNSASIEIIKLRIADVSTHQVQDSCNIIYRMNAPSREESLRQPIVDVSNSLKDLTNKLTERDTIKSKLGELRLLDSAIAITLGINRRDSLRKFEYRTFVDSQADSGRRTLLKTLDTNGTVRKIGDNYYSLKRTKQARIKVADGFIEHVSVTMKDGTKFIYQKPIPIVAFDNFLKKKVYTHRRDQFIFMGDVLSFDSNNYYNYFPDDSSYVIPSIKGDKEVQLKALSGLGAMVDFRLYTDLLGTFGEQPNGLVQFEASSKIPLTALNAGYNYFLNFIQPFIKLSKLDSKFDTIALISSPDGGINKMELFQRSFLNLGVRANFYKINWRPNNGISLNAGYMFSSGNVSIGEDTLTKANLHMPYLELGFSSKKLQNFGFDAEIRYGRQKMNRNKYFNGGGWDSFMTISTSLFFFTAAKSQDKFFLRFANYLYLPDRSEDFYQLQLGYSLNLSITKAIKK